MELDCGLQLSYIRGLTSLSLDVKERGNREIWKDVRA